MSRGHGGRTPAIRTAYIGHQSRPKWYAVGAELGNVLHSLHFVLVRANDEVLNSSGGASQPGSSHCHHCALVIQALPLQTNISLRLWEINGKTCHLVASGHTRPPHYTSLGWRDLKITFAVIAKIMIKGEKKAIIFLMTTTSNSQQAIKWFLVSPF